MTTTDLVRRTRSEQGVPERIIDPATLARIAQLVEPERKAA